MHDLNTASLQEALNNVGIPPLLPLTDHIVNTFGPFDLIPAPDAEPSDESEEWRDSWDDSYIISDDLVVAAARTSALRDALRNGQRIRNRSAQDEKLSRSLDGTEELKVDKERKEKMTRILAFLHTRGM